jgi:transposase/transposase IS116/IS110/IS902 family protein
MTVVFVGDDWAEDHHDVHVMDVEGRRLASRRLLEGLDGIRGFHELVAGRVEDPGEVIVGIETDRGLWVAALVSAGYQVYAINPLAASRYRDRHHLGGAKSDAADAKMLADLVRTDRHNHRLIAGDSSGVDAIRIIARGHQNLIWTRARQTNALRDALLQYFPAAVATFDDLADRDTVAVLAKAPTPAQAARLTTGQIQAALKRGGRQRNLQRRAAEIQAGLRRVELTAADPVADAFGATTIAAIAIIAELNRQIDQLENTLSERFSQHPDADIYLSLPGFGVVLGARALGEFGDDPNRYANAKSRRNYAGTSPLTIASGKKKAVVARYVTNKRLRDAFWRAAFSSLTRDAGCRTFYDQRRAAGDDHYKALRALSNHLAGILHGCLTHRTHYDEHLAWAHRNPNPTNKSEQAA